MCMVCPSEGVCVQVVTTVAWKHIPLNTSTEHPQWSRGGGGGGGELVL